MTGDAGVWLPLTAMAALAARAFGVLLFGTALASKARNLDEFTAIMMRYLGAGWSAARVAAGAVIALEGVAVLLLAVPATGALGGLLAAMLLLLFAAAMALALARGERELDCGCLRTALRQRVRGALVARNLVLAALFLPLARSAWTDYDAITIVGGLAAGGMVFLANLSVGTFVALDDSFAELKRRYG